MNIIDELYSLPEDEWHTAIIQFLEQGGDPNFQDPERQNLSILHIVLDEKNLEASSIIIQYGGETNIQDAYGATPLHHAIDAEIDAAIQLETEIDFTITKFLLSMGARLDIQNNSGQTPVDIVNRYGTRAQTAFNKLMNSL